MSLEAAIQENTQVLRELLARLAGGAIAPVAEAKKPDAKPGAASTQATAAAPAAQEQKAEASAKPLVYDDIKKPFYELCNKKGVEVGQKFLAEKGLPKLTEAKAEQYASILAEINALLAA